MQQGRTMAAGYMASPSPSLLSSRNLYPAAMAGFSCGLNGEMEGGGGREELSSTMGSESKEEELESRSAVDNRDTVGGGYGGSDSSEEEERDPEKPPLKRKAYHRHTPTQIQELEMYFKENHHPDEAARQELSRRLDLTPRQVKFWFQNRRTQSKCRLEKVENSILRQENDRLRADNIAMREAIRYASCPNCTLPSNSNSAQDSQLRLENSRIREELDRLYAFSGGKMSTTGARTMVPSPFALPYGSHASAIPELIPSPLALPPRPSASSAGSLDHSSSSLILNSSSPPSCLHTEGEKALIIDAAIAAMDEFLYLNRSESSVETPLWLSVLDSNPQVEALNYQEYTYRFPKAAASKPSGFRSEATRTMGTIMMNGLSIVESLLDVNHWLEMFPCMLRRAEIGEVISSGSSVMRNGALQTMHAELQVLSPLVPTREIYFVRFCKHLHENTWALVDFSIDMHLGDASNINKCRLRPSGCLIQEMPNGYSKVSWVEHWEYDDCSLHHLYRELITNGMAFGAMRWLVTMQRQCERMVSLMANNITPSTGCLTLEGRRSMLKLAQRMSISFCSSVCASPSYNWTTISGSGKDEDEVRVMTRKSIDSIGDANGVILNAATSIWLPVAPQRLFQFLRNENLRKEWDVLSMGGPMLEAVHIAKGSDPGNCVSLLKSQNAVPNNMLILQESCIDASGCLVVYAPVDVPNISAVMSGGDPSLVTILPSGFAILPGGGSEGIYSYETNENGLVERPPRGGGGGSLLTVAFQILVNTIPGSKLTIESIATVNSLVSNTVKQIKEALLSNHV